MFEGLKLYVPGVTDVDALVKNVTGALHGERMSPYTVLTALEYRVEGVRPVREFVVGESVSSTLYDCATSAIS
jgi:hypothetical protein